MAFSNPPVFYENLHLLNFEFEGSFKTKLSDFLNKGWYILGSEVDEFEKKFAAYCNAKFCVGVANGLDALELGLKVLDFPPQSEIIVAANTYIASILAIINAGHIPVLVEPDISTYNIDAELIEKKISKRAKAIMVVHLYGQAAQMDKITAIAKAHDLEIIEDCAQAHGATFQNKMAGTFGKIGAYSFYPTKNLGALGDAGAIITSDDEIYEKVKAVRNYGSKQKYYNKYIGRNSRLDEIQAAFLNVKLPFLNKINEHKRKLASIYHETLTEKVIKPTANETHVYHIYNIRTDRRNELKQYLLDRRIQTEIHYPLTPEKQEGYLKYFRNEDNRISQEIHATTLSLPISYANTEADVVTVSTAINEYFHDLR
jgi:dTDP-4-amino-4,6-dideoxygalactose transaminase